VGDVHIAFAGPLDADDVALERRDEDESTDAIGKCSDGPGASSDLAYHRLDVVVSSRGAPVLGGKLEVLEGLLNALGDAFDSARKLHLAKLRGARTTKAAGRSSSTWIASKTVATLCTSDVGQIRLHKGLLEADLAALAPFNDRVSKDSLRSFGIFGVTSPGVVWSPRMLVAFPPAKLLCFGI